MLNVTQKLIVSTSTNVCKTHMSSFKPVSTKMHPLSYSSLYLSLPACNNPKVLNKVSLNFMSIVDQFQILLKSEYNNRLLLTAVCTFVCASRV
jgi:hypothetical protein